MPTFSHTTAADVLGLATDGAIIGQPTPWADAYYAGLEAQLIAQLSGGITP